VKSWYFVPLQSPIAGVALVTTMRRQAARIGGTGRCGRQFKLVIKDGISSKMWAHFTAPASMVNGLLCPI
jgi:hypothetical protein